MGISAGCLGRIISFYALGDTFVDNHVGQPGNMVKSDTRIFHASQKEGGEADDKSYCAMQNA